MSSILLTTDAVSLVHVRRAGVLAVILSPPSREPWQSELATAVESGAFAFERFALMVPRLETLAHELDGRLPYEGLSFETRLALIDELVEMAAHLAQIAGCRAMMLRRLAEAPSDHCGFHVDTVPVQRPPFGLLRVYNGHGTHYVDPDDVTEMHDFYAYLGKRERLARERNEATSDSADQARTELAALDNALPFLLPDAP